MAECSLRCHLCDGVFLNDQSRSNHSRNFWKLATDATRCDNIQIAANRTRVPMITTPARVASDPVVSMARRLPSTWHRERMVRSRYAVRVDAVAVDARDFTLTQDAWDEKLRELANLYDIKFWKLYLAMHTLSGTAIDSALKVVKTLFASDIDPKRFPISRRSLLDKMGTLAPFWPRVLHTTRIDVSQFRLPSGTKEICFKFVDPIWG